MGTVTQTCTPRAAFGSIDNTHTDVNLHDNRLPGLGFATMLIGQSVVEKGTHKFAKTDQVMRWPFPTGR